MSILFSEVLLTLQVPRDGPHTAFHSPAQILRFSIHPCLFRSDCRDIRPGLQHVLYDLQFFFVHFTLSISRVQAMGNAVSAAGAENFRGDVLLKTR